MIDREPVSVSALLLRRHTPGQPTAKESQAEFDALAGEINRLRDLLRAAENERDTAATRYVHAEQDLADTVTARPGLRSWTPDRRTSATAKTIHLKRCCNGCGIELGDLTGDDFIGDTERLADVRLECPICQPAILRQILAALDEEDVPGDLPGDQHATWEIGRDQIATAVRHIIATGHGERSTETRP